MPEPSGSMRSQRMRSGSCLASAIRDSASEPAVSTRHPSSSKTMERKSRRDASSSTISRFTAPDYRRLLARGHCDTRGDDLPDEKQLRDAVKHAELTTHRIVMRKAADRCKRFGAQDANARVDQRLK